MRLIQILPKPSRHIHHLRQMLPPQLLLPKQRQPPCRANRITNLPTIELLVCDLVQVFVELGEIGTLAFAALLEHVEEVLPDLLARDAREVGVVDGDLDAGFEGFVEGADAVAREDEDA